MVSYCFLNRVLFSSKVQLYFMNEKLTESAKQIRKQRIAKLRTEIRQNKGVTHKIDIINEKFKYNNQKSLLEVSTQDDLRTSTKSSHQQIDFVDLFEQKYRVDEKIGEGGNGPVFKCFHKKNEITYAVKYIRVDEERKNELKKNFIFTKNLYHENIMKHKALYINQKKRLAYMVMEYLPLKSLDQFKIKDEEELKCMVQQLLEAIKYIHQKNICHRDIKPENILYDKINRTIKIIDFGNSKKTYSRGSRRNMLTVNGTYLFLAPEVFQGGSYDEKIDLWALGVTIFKLVSGNYPFESQYVGETVEKIKNGKYTFEESQWSRWSPSLKMFVQRLLKKVPKRMTIVEAMQDNWFQDESQKQNTFPINKKKRYSAQIKPSNLFEQDSIKTKTKSKSKKKRSSLGSRSLHKLKMQKATTCFISAQEVLTKAELEDQRIKEVNANAKSEDNSQEGSEDGSQDEIKEQFQLIRDSTRNGARGLEIPQSREYSTSEYQIIENDEVICPTPSFQEVDHTKSQASFTKNQNLFCSSKGWMK